MGNMVMISQSIICLSQNSVSLESGEAPHSMYSGESVVKSTTVLTEDHPYLAF